MDFSTLKALTIPEGVVQKIESIPISIVESYQDGYRFSSSGALKAQEGSVATGLIPCKTGSTIYMKGCEWGSSSTPPYGIGMFTYVMFYNDNEELVSLINGDMESSGTLPDGITITIDDNGVTTFDFSGFAKEFSFIRMSVKGNGARLVITYNYPDTHVLWEVIKYINHVLLSIDTDGSIYNNGLGYMSGYRVRSGGGITTNTSASHTGFIPVKGGDVVRIYFGGEFNNSAAAANAINLSDSSFTNLGQLVDNSAQGYGIIATDSYLNTNHNFDSIIEESEYVYKWIVPPDEYGIAYIRVTAHTADGANLIVTINEEIPI